MFKHNLKILLHMSALLGINMESDLRNYYIRKADEDENKLDLRSNSFQDCINILITI